MSIKRIEVKSRMIIAYYIILFTFVFVSHNISNYTSYENYINFDSWSENIMIADLIYYENYHDNSLYLKSLYPGCSVLENTHIIEKPEEIYYTYIEQGKYNKEDFQDYKSNICLHRYIYHVIVKAINTPFIRTVSVKLIHAPVISLTAHHKFTDTTNAYRAYSARYLQDERVKPLRDIFMTYELLAYLSVRATQIGYKACEIPVTRAYPKTGKTPTKISFFKGNSELLKILFRNMIGKYNP